MEQNENNKVQVALSPYHTGGMQDGYDLDRILFDLDSQIELYTAHPDRADLLVAIGSGILCGALDDLIKAAILHFALAYLHPYFDGNGRMARLLHLWYLVQQGYSSALFVPMSRLMEESCARYYKAYTRVEQNQRVSGVLDVTPFLAYFAESVYYRLGEDQPQPRTLQAFEEALQQGKVTEKERALWQFVLTAYGSEEFSTKRLEKDFGDAAYATIRSFVLKFESLGLLTSVRYGNRVKYRIKTIL